MHAYRLYFWFNGTPADRFGGPWWCRDFTREVDRATFFCAVSPSLRKAFTLDVTSVDKPLPVHQGPADIIPPRDAVLVHDTTDSQEKIHPNYALG